MKDEQAYSVAADELRQFIEQFEQLEAEKKDIAERQKEVMAEAKARGYDTKVMKKIVALRKRDLVPFGKMLAAMVVSWLVVNVPVYLRNPDAWGEFNRLNTDRGWEWTTIYAVISRAFGWTGFDSGEGAPVILNSVTLILFLLGCAFVLVLGLKAPQTPRIAELVALIVGFFLLFNKVWSPQYSLWLVVPAVLALPYWRVLLGWMTVDMCVWPVLMWHMMGADNLGVPGWFLNMVIISRDALIIAIMVLVVQQILGRRRDKVRDAHNGHDPLMSLPYQWKEPLPIDAPPAAPAAEPADAEPAGSTAVKA